MLFSETEAMNGFDRNSSGADMREHKPHYLEDAALVAAARQGDEQAFEELIQRARPQMYAVALRSTKSHEDAEDALQQAFFKAWKMLKEFRGESLFRTWLTRIVLNESLQLRRKGDYRNLDYSDTLTIAESQAYAEGRLRPAMSPEEQVIAGNIRTLLYDVLAKMPPALRCVLELDVLRENSYEEISTKLGITVPAVKSRKLRARAELVRRFSNRTRRALCYSE